MENKLSVIVCLILKCISCIPLHENKIDPTVIFAFSGLRWDSFDLGSMDALEKLKEEAVLGKRKIDAFQSESLPSFVTMVSGKYTEQHGMISNNMKDLVSGEMFDVTVTSSKWWNEFEPIWITNQKSCNNTRKSALCYWPGHDVKFGDLTVSYACKNDSYVDPFKQMFHKKITGDVMPFEERVEHVHTWLKMNATERPNFIGVYFEEPLKTMSKYGIYSNQTKDMLKKIDMLIATTIKRFTNDGVYEKMTFIVTGESGVTELNSAVRKEVFLEDKLSDEQKRKFTIIDDGPITTIYPHDNNTKYELVKLWDGVKGIKVYTKETLKSEFHFSHKQRTMPIVIIAEEHWRIYRTRLVDDLRCLMGYDGKYPSSHSLFIAKGPQLKKKLSLDAIGNVDIYGVLLKTLNITEHPKHHGNGATISQLFVKEEKWIQKVVTRIVKTITKNPTNIVVSAIIAVLIFFVFSFVIITVIYKAVGWCACPNSPRLVKVPSPSKLLRKRKQKNTNRKKAGAHLLSDEELSDSDLSSAEEFYFDSVERKK